MTMTLFDDLERDVQRLADEQTPQLLRRLVVLLELPVHRPAFCAIRVAYARARMALTRARRQERLGYGRLAAVEVAHRHAQKLRDVYHASSHLNHCPLCRRN